MAAGAICLSMCLHFMILYIELLPVRPHSEGLCDLQLSPTLSSSPDVSLDHLPDHPSEPDPGADGFQDLFGCHPPG